MCCVRESCAAIAAIKTGVNAVLSELLDCKLPPSAVQCWTMFSLKKKVKPMVFDDVTAGLKGVTNNIPMRGQTKHGGALQVYKDYLLPLETEYNFHEFHSPKLENPDFDGKPLVRLVQTILSAPLCPGDAGGPILHWQNYLCSILDRKGNVAKMSVDWKAWHSNIYLSAPTYDICEGPGRISPGCGSGRSRPPTRSTWWTTGRRTARSPATS